MKVKMAAEERAERERKKARNTAKTKLSFVDPDEEEDNEVVEDVPQVSLYRSKP